MSYEEVCAAVEKLKKKYDETDPIRLCNAMGVILIREAFGTAPDAIKGFFLETHRIKTITVNSSLPTVVQKIIIAHELGHAALHKKAGVFAFHEVGLFDESSVMEKEANLFAAELLLDDKEVLDTLNSDGTFFTAASELYVPIELLDFKFRVMKWKGYKLMEPPISARSNFLKDMDIPRNTDCESC